MTEERTRSLRVVSGSGERPTLPAVAERGVSLRAEAVSGVARDASGAALELLGSLSLIHRALASDSPQLSVARLRAHVEAALNAASDAARLAKEITVYAGRDPLPPEPVWVHEALGTALLLVGPRIEHRGHFRFARTDDAQIVARAATLVRVFIGVIVELIEPSLEPGAPHDIQIDTVLRGRELEIVITDASARWSPEAVDHSLSQRDLVARSALRGLASVRTLLASIGGHLGVETGAGAGVTVLILLPTVEPASDPERYA